MGYLGLNASTYFSSTGEGGVPCPTCGTLYDNATLWSINAGTGVLNWHHPLASLQGYRGQIEVSGNLVFAVLSSGDIAIQRPRRASSRGTTTSAPRWTSA